MDRRTIFLLVVLICFIIFLIRFSTFVWQNEGFVDAPSKTMAKLPKSNSSSNVPNTMPGATTKNPIDVLASYKDIASLIDIIKIYNELYDKYILNVYKNIKYQNLHNKSIPYLIKLQAQIDTGKIVDTLNFITNETRIYRLAIKSINSEEETYMITNKKQASSVTKPMIKGNGPASLKDLEYAIERAKNEQKRIDDLRSESSDFKRRSLILEKIQIDFKQLHNKIKKGDIKISSVPINKEDLRKFLIRVEDPTSKLSPLPKLKPAEDKNRSTRCDEGFANMNEEDEQTDDVEPNNEIDDVSYIDEGFNKYANNYINDSDERDEDFQGETNATTQQLNNNIQIPKEYKKLINDLRSSMRDINWEMNVGIGYDPNVTIQRRITERLNSISNDIKSSRLNKNELKSKFLELEILKQQLESYNSRRIGSSQSKLDTMERPNKYGSPNLTDNKLLPEEVVKESTKKPVKNNLSTKQQILTSIGNPLPSNDYRIRPGYEMTDEDIQKRGSRATFDPTLVGTLDYKKTVQFLCSQIKSSGLGNPREFGCIENPDTDVSNDYSWKGNYKMVCSRLGHTWGNWYPEMFGCPKSDEEHMQIPKINKTCSTSTVPPIKTPKKPCMV